MTVSIFIALTVFPGALILTGWCLGVIWERGRGEREQRARRFKTQPIPGATLRKLARFASRRAKSDEVRDGQQ